MGKNISIAAKARIHQQRTRTLKQEHIGARKGALGSRRSVLPVALRSERCERRQDQTFRAIPLWLHSGKECSDQSEGTLVLSLYIGPEGPYPVAARLVD